MNRIELIAKRLRDGSVRDAAPLRHEIEESLTFIIRRTVRTRSVDTSLTRRILAEADSCRNMERDIGLDRLVSRVCRTLCDAVIDGLCRRSRDSVTAYDTVAN